MANVEYQGTARLEPPEIVEAMKSMSQDEATQLLREMADVEEELERLNLLKPHKAKGPQVLRSQDMSSLVWLFSPMEGDYIRKILFGNFRAIPDDTRQELLEELPERTTASLFESMSLGVDNPKTAGKVLKAMTSSTAGQVVEEMATANVVRIFEDMAGGDKARIVASLDTERAVEVIHALWKGENVVRTARVANILRQMNAEKRGEILDRLEATPQGLLREEVDRQYSGKLGRVELKEAKGLVSAMEPAEAVEALQEVDAARSTDVLRLCEAEKAAAILMVLARENPDQAANILEEIDSRIVVGFKVRKGVREALEEIYMCPSASILDKMDFSLPGNRAALERIDRGHLELVLDRMSEAKREEIRLLLGIGAELAFSVEMFAAGKGRRRSRRVDYGLKWTRIEESLDVGEKIKPVIIDLVDMDPEKVGIQARRAITDDTLLPVAELKKIFGAATREGKKPDEALFTKLGMVRLSEMVEKYGAIAGLNGNYYYDYGHYTDLLKLGVDPSNVPGLFFGDPSGWFVCDGIEVTPPSFNRAAFVVAESGQVYIDRVFMTRVRLPNGQVIEWDEMNVPKEPGKIILYNSVYAFKTDEAESHVDLAITRGKIWAIVEGGASDIPLTGFTLSIPLEKKDALLKGIKVGDEVTVDNNFPPSRGRVMQAMASGPYLVRDGQLAISFEAEDFGEKDSTVMSFSLTRAVQTFEAARSFMMLKDDKLTIGTVSGTRLGSGVPSDDPSMGMTFGELGQLAMDLGADQAYALDGGGSSSIVVWRGGKVDVLNTPTGGSDVPRGKERFINTYWLFFPRE